MVPVPRIPASPEPYVCTCPAAYGGPHPDPGPGAMEVDLYRRVSLVKAKDRKRGDEEVAVERQTWETCAMCYRMRMRIVRMWTDNDVSATSGVYRPAFEGILLHNDTRTVVTYHTDRFVRLNKEMTRVEHRGLTVYGVHSSTLDLTTPYGVATAVVQTAFAEAEGKQKALRQKSQNRQVAADGQPRWWTHTPFGFNKDATHNPVQAAALKAVYENILMGQSMGSQVRWLNEQGLISNTGAKWQYGSLRHVLLAHRNAGIRTYTTRVKSREENGKPVKVVEEIGKGNWEPIVSRETFDAVVHLLNDPKRLTAGPRNGKVPMYLVTGFALCGKCGAGIHAHKVTRQNKNEKKEYRYYTCRTPQRCCNHDMEFVDSYVLRKAIGLLRDPEYRRLWSEPSNIDAQPAIMEKARLQEKIKALGEQFALDVIPMETMIAGTNMAKARIAEIDTLLVQTGSSAPLMALMEADEEALWARVENNLTEQRKIITTVFQSIKLLPRNGSREMRGDMIVLEPHLPS